MKAFLAMLFRFRLNKTVTWLLPFAFAIGSLIGSSSAPSATRTTAPKNACTVTELQQIDFWIGTWLVKDAEGGQVGSSEVSTISDGCAIIERWSGRDGVTGTSVTYYDQRDAKWHQDWVGGAGQILHLNGTLFGSAMILTGEHQTGQGPLSDRVTWTGLPDGTVKQVWEISTNSGESWKIVFEGLYQRR